MGKTFFTADTHFGHANIIGYCERPFKSVEEMDFKLMKNINERVKPEDTLFVVGDFAYRSKTKPEHYRNRILCENVIFLVGNHDWNNNLKSKIKSMIIHAGGREIFLTHIPEDTQVDFELNLCAHVHGAWKWKELNGCILINVGVDVWEYYPVELNEVLNLFDKARKTIIE